MRQNIGKTRFDTTTYERLAVVVLFFIHRSKYFYTRIKKIHWSNRLVIRHSSWGSDYTLDWWCYGILFALLFLVRYLSI